MKKLFTLALVALFAMGVSAQQGSMYLGTSGISFWNGDDDLQSKFLTGFSYTDVDDLGKVTSFGLAPEFGYFIADNMAIGISVGFTYSSIDPEGVDSYSCTSFGVAPYFRYYLVQSGNFGFYLQGGLQFSTSKYDYDDAESTNYFNVGILPGISYSFSDRFCATASFGWLGYENIKQDDYKVNQFGLALDASALNLGLQVKF
ncbi:MAG: porin family protein [Candidatus Azobacteroides sp.]|nr:porin family protein [Candidatus Azobacteroides sp.]